MTKWIGLEVDASELAVSVAEWKDVDAVIDFIAEIDAFVGEIEFTEALIERLQESLDLEKATDA